jgi:polyisoprenoid-binding protein YceI
MSNPTAASSLAGRWAIEPAASDITFNTSGLLGLMKVNGRISAKNGIMSIDSEGLGGGRFSFDVTTIDTGIKKRDAHLNRADFFDTATWPEATFSIDEITATDGKATVRGELVIRDKAIPVHVPITVAGAGENRVVEATVPVDHHAAGLPFRKPVMISGKATVNVRLTLTPA